jgi:hypothetical protein
LQFAFFPATVRQVCGARRYKTKNKTGGHPLAFSLFLHATPIIPRAFAFSGSSTSSRPLLSPPGSHAESNALQITENKEKWYTPPGRKNDLRTHSRDSENLRVAPWLGETKPLLHPSNWQHEARSLDFSGARVERGAVLVFPQAL